MKRDNQPSLIRLGAAAVELRESRQHEFLGLGNVTIGRVALRSDARPITVRLDTPDGIFYTRLVREKINRARDRVEIVLQAIGVPWERGEYHDDFSQPLVWLEQPTDPVTDRLTLVLRPVKLDCGGRRWSGFSYEFTFASRQRRLHRLLTHATWEIGGRITGNTVLHQGQCNRPVYRGAKNKLFTTACLRTLDQYGSPQGNSFQLGPRAGLIQGFDFQYAVQGALWQWWPRYESVSSLLESPRGSDLLHVVDEYRFELGRRVSTMPKWVLFTPGPFAEPEARDVWWACREQVYGSMRRRFGIRRTVVKPEIAVNFETILDGRRHRAMVGEGWQASGRPRANVKRSRLRIRVADVEVEHPEVCYALADHLLPRLARQGIRRFMPDPLSESDVTVLGLRRKLDDGPHGNLRCSSTCATHRFFPAEFWGGIKGWRYLYRRAQALGIELGHWFAPHLSARSPIYAQHPEYQMIDVLGFPAGGGLGPGTVTVADWNTGVRRWIFDDLKRWQEDGGLDYLVTDSYASFGMLQRNYSARMRTNYVAFARFLAEVQTRLGIRSLGFEGISPFGISMFGVVDLRGELRERDQAVAGQNDFGWWVGAEDMAGDCWQNVAPRRRSVAELQGILFRTLANRGYVNFGNLYDSGHRLPAWWTRLNHIYNQALPQMYGRRQLLPDGAGVRWTDGATEILWLYRDQPVAGAPRTIARVTETGFVGLPPDTRALDGGQVYRLRRRGARP